MRGKRSEQLSVSRNINDRKALNIWAEIWATRFGFYKLNTDRK